MTKRLVYTFQDTVNVIVPFIGSRLIKYGNDVVPAWSFSRDASVIEEAANNSLITWAETEEDWLNRVKVEASVPDNVVVTVVDKSELPTKNEFRNAWELNNETVSINMPKAREIYRDYLRGLRKIQFEILDAEYMIADEENNNTKKQEIITEKQRLRNITDDPRIEEATTPEELKVVTIGEINTFRRR